MTDLFLALALVALALAAYGVGWEGCRLYWSRKNAEAMRRSGLMDSLDFWDNPEDGEFDDAIEAA